MTDRDELREQADDYQDHEIDLPFTGHPFDALKAHNLVFGVTLGTLFGVIGAMGLSSSSTTLAAGSAIATVSLALYAYGFDPPGPVEPADAKLTIATKQIKRKPHYFTGALTTAYIIAISAGATLFWLF